MFTCMVFKISLTFLLQTEALPPANEKSFLWILKKARCRRHFWAFGLSLKEHCFHQFESNLKTRHYEYASDFEGYFICSFVSAFSVLIFISQLFSKKAVVFISWKQWSLYRCLFFIFVRWFMCFIFLILPYFSTIIFQKKWNPMFFFEKISWKNQNPLGFFKKTPLLNNRGRKSKFLKFKSSPWI